MGEQRGATWWYEHNARVLEMQDGMDVRQLPDHVCELLDEVESAFAVTGAGTPAWAGRPFHESPDEEEYSRCLDPGKYRIVPARIEAWIEVLTGRGWAELDRTRSAGQRGFEYSTTITLRPQSAGAVPLVFTIFGGTDPEAMLNVVLSAADPSVVDQLVALAELPGCGCDACDMGSAWLLEELDQWVLSVVDGSLEVDQSAELQVRSSFGGHGVGGAGARGSSDSPAFVAAPWAERWTPMPMPSGIGCH